ncbi:DUF6607 family protein [Halomonas cerina]|uniref:Uncharacterized protein n=1 Tax=Halomonas cerina TaxID=447424 RepID=A0A839VBS6_9GAMM|nr:DUF6607 family protein [Halomonas cerina]MBB3192581.1 hypothetical protein [Halomonas cerina]
MRRIGVLVLGAALVASSAAWGAEDSESGRRHIEHLAGCFEVTYRFAEDGVHDIFSEEYGLEEGLLEWLALETLSETAYRLTHMSVLENRVMPHFHEIWRYLPDEEGWQHEVWSRSAANPAKELRYTCSASWVHNTWSCHAGKAEKPFRDSGAPFGFDRTDYDYLDRDNTLLVTPEGWIHAQHNLKKRESGEVVAHELGWITYRRVDDQRCASAHEWLQQQRGE